MTISERVFLKMEEMDLTQKHFSELTGIRQSTISEWKKKRTNPSADKIMVICSVLKVTPEWLLSGTEVESEYRNQVDWLIIDRTSELGSFIIDFNNLPLRKRDRLLGYMDALKEKD